LTSNESNVTGTLNVLLTSRDEGVRRVVVASSSSVYGPGKELPKHEAMPTVPIAPYAVAKLAAEAYGRTFFQVYGLETVALRYFNVFGPRQDPRSEYAAVIPRFATALLTGRQPVIYGDGEQSRDFTYVDNTVAANVLAAAAPDIAGQTFNVACGERISLNALLDELRSIIGTDISAAYEERRAGDILHSLADISRARDAFGYEPAIGIREGLERTVAALGPQRSETSPGA
jgi:UDP-glucose 4-epimerase